MSGTSYVKLDDNTVLEIIHDLHGHAGKIYTWALENDLYVSELPEAVQEFTQEYDDYVQNIVAAKENHLKLQLVLKSDTGAVVERTTVAELKPEDMAIVLDELAAALQDAFENTDSKLFVQFHTVVEQLRHLATVAYNKITLLVG
ncbi:hypothetical protein LCGC14_1848500 [marine sediment metagenome]|uniref:Uncharacterized protein n=1 Tax=marine sediment metagenome TaxID=412755 RepID=A0A0F9GB03_9ZZZZ